MSRFFRAADDTSSSSSSEASDSEESDTPAQTAGARTTVAGAPAGRSRFLNSDSDDDDVKRISKSAKDRQYEALEETSNAIKAHLKNNDWSSLREDFDNLNEQLEKCRKKDMVSGRAPPVPEIYIRAIITLEEALKKTLEEKPKMSKTNSVNLNKMKLRIPKNNRTYKDEIDKLLATGKATLYDVVEDDSESDTEDDAGEEEASEESSDEDGQEPVRASVAAKAAKARAEDNDEDDSDEWPSDDDTETESSDDGGAGGRASKWLKKDDSEAAVKKKKIRKTGAERDHLGEADADLESDDGFVTVERRRGAAKQVIRPEDMTVESVEAKLLEVLQARGRKGTNRREQIDLLVQLVAAAKTPKQEIEITFHLISARFDAIPTAKLFMPAPLWREALANAQQAVALSKKHFPRIRFADESDALSEEPLFLFREDDDSGVILDPSGVPITPAQVAAATAAAKAESAAAAAAAAADPNGQIIVRGDLTSTFERFDDELYRAWQNTDAYSLEYVDRLKDEVGLLELAEATQSYLETAAGAEESKGSSQDPEGSGFNEARLNGLRARAARVACRRVLHMYFKSTELNEKVKALQPREGDSGKTLAELATLVYRYGDDYAKSQTMLAHIYNHALDNRFYEARDMFLMSHLQETISGMDIPLQVMFNRAMAQLGLCAFRLGMAWESHACLQELCSPSYGGGGGGPARLKELLAQGLTQQRGHEKTPEQEKAEIRRQIPYHMHVNLDFIETAHLTSAMLLEVPSMALSKARGDVRRWPISKSFQYFLRSSMKQAFPGPPENTRDFVMAATRCMMKGEWKSAYEYIANIRSWKSLSTKERTDTLNRLQELVKVEALRTFTLSYSSYFESMSVKQLSLLYELTPAKVHSVLSKMIINGELRASWDQPTASMVMRRTEPSRLQSLALQLAAKVTNMTDNNEKLLDAKSGGGDRDRNDRDNKGDRDGKGDWKQGGGGGRGGRGRGGRGGRSGGGYGRDRDRGDSGIGGGESRSAALVGFEG